MTAITSAECDIIAISSEYLLVDNQTNVLTVIHNGETTYTPTIASTVTSIDLDNDLLDLEGDTLADGVYSIQLLSTALNGDINTESVCAVVLCDKHCDMVELYLDKENADKILAYEALKIAQGCVTCNCTTMLALYNVLINVVDNDCGCD